MTDEMASQQRPTPQIGSSRRPRHKFSPQEDAIITATVLTGGPRATWAYVASQLTGRTARQVRERYVNYLAQDLDQRPWMPEEDNLLIELVKAHGCKWSFLASSFPGRTDVSLKNHYHKLMRRRSKAQSRPIQIRLFEAHDRSIVPKVHRCSRTTVRETVPISSLPSQFEGAQAEEMKMYIPKAI